MKYLKIQNDGILEIGLVALMGGTTKSKDQYKIGQFGTGLKYTFAYLFRNNLAFKIFAGEEEVKISTEIETIRNEEFEIICINGNRTSITTRMGEDWSTWMIIRELWCNALDEGGSVKDVTEDTIGLSGKTTFYIQIDNRVKEVIDNWHRYFIHGQEPVHSDNTYKLYPAGDHLCIYKQGVLIYQDEKVKSIFSYDVANADINELREFKGSKSWAITSCLANASAKAITYFLENITDGHFEGSQDMDYEWYLSWSGDWKETIGEAKIITQKSIDDAKASGIDIDVSRMVIVPKGVYKALTKQFEGIGALRLSSKQNEFLEHYDPIMENKIKQVLTILESCNYVINPELDFVYGFFGDKRIQGSVNLDEKKVYISNALLQKPLFTIIGVIIEENEHFNTGMSDNSREFQQHFIDLYTRALLAEHSIEI